MFIFIFENTALVTISLKETLFSVLESNIFQFFGARKLKVLMSRKSHKDHNYSKYH